MMANSDNRSVSWSCSVCIPGGCRLMTTQCLASVRRFVLQHRAERTAASVGFAEGHTVCTSVPSGLCLQRVGFAYCTHVYTMQDGEGDLEGPGRTGVPPPFASDCPFHCNRFQPPPSATRFS